MTRKEIKEMKKRWREALATPTKPLYDPVPLKDVIDSYLECQESCEDCISFPKGTLKKRGKDYVVYNYAWLKENWQTELKVMGIDWKE